MEGRITDIGPHKYNEYFPPVIKNNFGKWLYHEILEPGVLVHVAESATSALPFAWVVPVPCPLLTSVSCATSPTSNCGGYLRWTTRNNIEFMVDSEAGMKALRDDLEQPQVHRRFVQSPRGRHRRWHQQHGAHPGLGALLRPRPTPLARLRP